MKSVGKERWYKRRCSYKLDDGTRISQTVESNTKVPRKGCNRKPVFFHGWGAKEFLEYALKANLRITRIDCDLGRVRTDCFGSKYYTTEAR